jgi:hypothetical protein
MQVLIRAHPGTTHQECAPRALLALAFVAETFVPWIIFLKRR